MSKIHLPLLYICSHTHTHTHTHTRVCVCIHIHSRTFVYTHTYAQNTHRSEGGWTAISLQWVHTPVRQEHSLSDIAMGKVWGLFLPTMDKKPQNSSIRRNVLEISHKIWYAIKQRNETNIRTQIYTKHTDTNMCPPTTTISASLNQTTRGQWFI